MWSPLFYSNEPTSLTHENFSHIYFHRIIVSDIVRLYREKGTRKINKLSIPSSIIANISLFRSFPLFFFFKDANEFHVLTRKLKVERENTCVISFRSFAKTRRERNGRYQRMAGHSRLYTRAEYTHTVGTKSRDRHILTFDTVRFAVGSPLPI